MLDFSDKERKFHIVFASEDDRYYTDSLMELDLEQYLWLSLRNTHEKVWFISVAGSKKIKVECFDDKPSDNCELKSRKKKGFFAAGQKEPFEWFTEQSEQDDRQAFVMDKDSFRNLFETDRNIQEFKNITVVLVLRPKISELREVILEDYPLIDPFSSYIRELRREKTSDIIFRLHNHYGRDCFFMQSFTKDNIRNMLLYVMFGDTEKAGSISLIEYMTAYLVYYLNNRSVQWYDSGLFSACRNTSVYGICPLYKDIRKALSNDTVWKCLKERASCLYRLDGRDPSNALRLYADEKELVFRNDTVIYMYPELNSKQEYILNSDPVRYGIKTDSVPKSIRKYVFEHYELLHRTAMTTGTCDEDKVSVYTSGKLTDKFCGIRSETAADDLYERYFRYLICIGKCLKLIYNGNAERTAKGIENIERYIKTADDLFRDLRPDEAAGIMADADNCFCQEKDQKLFDEAVGKCRQMMQINDLKNKPFEVTGYKPPEIDKKWKNF